MYIIQQYFARFKSIQQNLPSLGLKWHTVLVWTRQAKKAKRTARSEDLAV